MHHSSVYSVPPPPLSKHRRVQAPGGSDTVVSSCPLALWQHQVLVTLLLLEGVLFPYWELRWEDFYHRESTWRESLVLDEDRLAQWLGAQLRALPLRQLQHAESAGRFWVEAEQSDFRLGFNVEKIHVLRKNK